MYQVNNKSNIFYRKNILTGKIIGPLSKEEFLYKIREEFEVFQNIWHPSIDWNTTGEKNIHVRYYNPWNDNDFCYDRTIIYYDGNLRIIDPRNYLSLVMKITKEDLEKYNRKQLRLYTYYKSEHYKYRNSPVPHTGKHKGGPHSSKRCTSLRHTYKLYTDPEYGKYIRKKALPLKSEWFSYYYDYPEVRTRTHESWKNQKKRKQWM